MSTEGALLVSEHLVADPKRRDAAADRLDHARKLSAQDRRPGLDKAGEGSHEERPGSPIGAVRPIHRGRVDLDEQPIVPRSGLLTSEITITSGGPYLVQTAAFIAGV